MTVQSLVSAVDRLDEAHFYGQVLPDQDDITAVIVARQGGAGAYAGSFALMPEERAAGIRVFTGEHMTSASARHIIGEESCCVLRRLKRQSPAVKQAIEAAGAAMRSHIIGVADGNGHPGLFCCGRCSVALWRHLAAGGFDSRETRLADGMKHLRQHRDGQGGWTRFPFHYTVLAMTEIGPELARSELQYAAPALEKKLSRRPAKGAYAQRRHDVMSRALTLV
jgi:hypothetical protein